MVDGYVIEDDAPTIFPKKRFDKKRVNYDDDDVVDDDNRFKLTNNKKVCKFIPKSTLFRLSSNK